MPDHSIPPVKGSRRVANVLENLTKSGLVPHYTPEAVGAQSHNADEPGVTWVEIDHILDSPYQHQEQVDQENFQALVASIKSEGFLAALNVNSHAQRAGYYVLTAGGHQRRDAAKAAGLKKIPVFVEATLDPQRLAFRAAKENVVRVNVSPVNLGLLFLQMQEEFGLTQEEIADELHKGRNYVKFCIMAARSGPDIQQMLLEKPDSLRAMTYLRRLDAEEDRRPIIGRFLAGELTTEGVQAAVEQHLLQKIAIAQSGESSDKGADYPGPLHLPTKRTDRDGPDTGTHPGGEETLAQRTLVPSDHVSSLQTEHAVEPGTEERLGKLKVALSRFETYTRSVGAAPLSEPERKAVKQLVDQGSRLLGLVTPPQSGEEG